MCAYVCVHNTYNKMLMAAKTEGRDLSSIAALRLFSDCWFELRLKVLYAIEKIKKMLNLYRH